VYAILICCCCPQICLYNIHLLISYLNRDSSVILALGYGLDDRGFGSRQGLGTFLFTTASRPALGPIQPPVQWVPGALSLGVKQPSSETDHSPPSSAEVKNAWSYTSTLTTPSRRGAQLKHRDSFTFSFNLFLIYVCLFLCFFIVSYYLSVNLYWQRFHINCMDMQCHIS
jgi:hypothetical protein